MKPTDWEKLEENAEIAPNNFGVELPPGFFKPPAKKESSLEASLVDWCDFHGICFPKMQKKKHWPDRFLLLPNRQIVWFELKRKGEKPTPGQREIHDYLRRQGHEVEVHDNRAEAIASIIRRLETARLPTEICEIPFG